MGTLSLTLPTAGSTLNSVADPEIVTAFTTVQTLVNGNIDGANVAATLTGRRLVGEMDVFLNGAVAATYFSCDGSQLASGGSLASLGPKWWHLDPAGFAITGKSNTQLIVRLSVATNATAPTVSFAGKLCAVTFAGGGNVIVPTVGTQAGTSATVTTPGASSVAVAETSAFTFPTAGAYAPVITVSGSQASNSAVMAVIQLFAINS